MIQLRKMSESEFSTFKRFSQDNYAKYLATVESVDLTEGLKNADDQFSKLVPKGVETEGQLFYTAKETAINEDVGYLWLGIQTRFGRKVATVNDVYVDQAKRGQGFGREIMKQAENEARAAGATKIRLHVFADNLVARFLYEGVGFSTTSVDMGKMLI